MRSGYNSLLMSEDNLIRMVATIRRERSAKDS